MSHTYDPNPTGVSASKAGISPSSLSCMAPQRPSRPTVYSWNPQPPVSQQNIILQSSTARNMARTVLTISSMLIRTVIDVCSL